MTTSSTDNSVNYGSRVHGSIVNSTLTNALNTVNEIGRSGSKQQLAAELRQLLEQGGKLIDQLPEKRAMEVARDLESLAKEANSSAPRKAWYELSAKGLIDAAKTVATMAAPITQAVQRVLEMLNGSFD